ncbi:MAG: hemerythrin domain-containing protein, partial [Pseudomonadota bacterium]|nr:hemerythrin domain-containing protein [Pseudomonadota bacterium]
VTHHLDEEEQEVFQLAGRALGDSEKTSLAKTYRQEMESREAS